MSHSDVRNKISKGTVIDGGSERRFEGTIIDDVSQGPKVHFINGVYRGRGGGSWVCAGGVFWGRFKIADSGGIKNNATKYHDLQ